MYLSCKIVIPSVPQFLNNNERIKVVQKSTYDKTFDILCSKIPLHFCEFKLDTKNIKKEASRGAAAQSVTVKPTRCGFDLYSRR